MGAAAVMACGMLLMGGCDFGEPRPFKYEKGVYLGKPHTPLDDKALLALRARADCQRDGGGIGGGSGTPAVGRAVASVPTATRKAGPGMPAAADSAATGKAALRQRAAHQRGF